MKSASGSSGTVAGTPAGASRSKGGLLLVAGVALLGVAGVQVYRTISARRWMQTYKVVARYPHDPAAYCQGLVFDGGVLHESTGRMGQSTVRTVELETGKVLRKTELPGDLFGEGLAMVDDRLIQLTWEQGVARIYERATLKAKDQFQYEGEGWGLTFDGKHLIHSDGSEFLVFRDPATFKEVRRVRVLAKGTPVKNLNELEMVEGEIWANVWKSDFILRIDPRDGSVLGMVDMAGIFDRHTIDDEDAVLNGIAYDPEKKRIFVTGKLWPSLFEIQVVEKSN